MSSDLLPSSLTLEQQLAVLRSALDRIAQWHDADVDGADEPWSASIARKALAQTGYHHVPSGSEPLTLLADVLAAAGVRVATDDEVRFVREAWEGDFMLDRQPAFSRWLLVNRNRFNS